MIISHAFPRTVRAAAALLLVGLFQAAPARANIVFDFSGVCRSGCGGTATGVLTLTDSYAFGANIKAADFISFTYSSSGRSFDLTSAENPSLAGSLNADGSFNASKEFAVSASTGGFPAFEATTGEFQAVTRPGQQDLGGSFTFTLAVSGNVPEPSTWAMMLLGFAGLGFAGYRAAKRPASTGA
jgi:hypothetical protein